MKKRKRNGEERQAETVDEEEEFRLEGSWGRR